jgi:DNA repair protein RadC
MKIKEMSEDSRPRERLVKFGIQNLSDAEILALILEKGTRKENVIEMSQRLLGKYGIDKLSECSLSELQEISGIGFAKACQISALFEFSKRHYASRNNIKIIKCANDVFDYFHGRLKDEKQENFIVLLLSTKNHIIGEQLISKGILDASIVHPREIFKPAIKNSASKIILVHNHPSGDSNPSDEDLEITDKLIAAGKLIDIQILDHVIIGNGNFWSWIEKNT